MKNIFEYLLSKNRKPIVNDDEEYIVCYPTHSTFIELLDKFPYETIKIDDRVVFVLKKKDVQEYINKRTQEISVYELPDEYKHETANKIKLAIHSGKCKVKRDNLIYGKGL